MLLQGQQVHVLDAMVTTLDDTTAMLAHEIVDHG